MTIHVTGSGQNKAHFMHPTNSVNIASYDAYLFQRTYLTFYTQIRSELQRFKGSVTNKCHFIRMSNSTVTV